MCFICVCITAIYVCVVYLCYFFFFKQKTAYDLRISDWSSDVCSSDLQLGLRYCAALTESPGDGTRLARERASDTDVVVAVGGDEIGRASCRERVCQYV